MRTGRDVVAYLLTVERRCRRMREPIDARPFITLIQGRIDAILRADPDTQDAAGQVLASIGWDNQAGQRRWYRWRHEAAAHAVERADIEDALHRLGLTLGDLYPGLDADVQLGPDGWCGACAERVTPSAQRPDNCPWCDETLTRFTLGQRRERPQREDKPSVTIRSRPRLPRLGKPVYLDVMLGERRKALEAFAEHGTWVAAARAIRPGIFSSLDSAAIAVRSLAVREGWASPAPRGAIDPEQREQARQAVRAALADGSWDHVEPQREWIIRRDIAEHLVQEALWLYWYDGLSFAKVAARLWPLTAYKNDKTLSIALLKEWDARGWPRRTHSGSAQWTAPEGAARCAATTAAGKPCRRWARRGQRLCFHHDPANKTQVLQQGRAASELSYIDAVDVEPWAAWLRTHALPQAGSVKELHRRLGGAQTIGYNKLTDWIKRYAGDRGRRKVRRVRRATVQRILAAWNDGTRFEDIYVPTPTQEVADAA